VETNGKADEAPKPPEPDHARLSVKELKELLSSAGVSFAGATEKDDLVRLLSRAKAQAALRANMFVPTSQWKEVPTGVALPPGLEVKFDLQKGCQYARKPQARDRKTRGTTSSSSIAKASPAKSSLARSSSTSLHALLVS